MQREVTRDSTSIELTEYIPTFLLHHCHIADSVSESAASNLAQKIASYQIDHTLGSIDDLTDVRRPKLLIVNKMSNMNVPLESS